MPLLIAWSLAASALTLACASTGRAEPSRGLADDGSRNPCTGPSLQAILLEFRNLTSVSPEGSAPFFVPLREGHAQAARDLLERWDGQGHFLHLENLEGVAQQLRESMERLAQLLPDYDARSIQDSYTELVWQDPSPEFLVLLEKLRRRAGPNASPNLTLRQRMRWAEYRLAGRDRGLSEREMLELFEKRIYAAPPPSE